MLEYLQFTSYGILWLMKIAQAIGFLVVIPLLGLRAFIIIIQTSKELDAQEQALQAQNGS
ncbi:hypothetical protein HON36_02300 [Candidatus Parcubacteria bacterium]|jgi:hypothetical protein|nr:hypothetical protein [Candidatus Parcubacteria bacterium]MBT7228062.1 hypothetical protein [Candidatus Parcubacteria bacterium]